MVGRDLPTLAYADRLAALQAHRIALWDVIATARRQGSSDAAIADVSANDLVALVRSLPNLRAVAFNGGKAATIGAPLLAAEPVERLTLPSSSPLHTIGIAAKQPAWRALATYLT